MSNNMFESLIGAIVLLVAGWFLVFAYERGEASVAQGYELVARFDRVDGLSIGSDVRLAGIKVGTITKQTLDPVSFQALVSFSVNSDYELPVDTAVAITSEGLLGGSYLAILPGGMDEMLLPGDEISETQDAVDLIGLISRFAYGSGDDD